MSREGIFEGHQAPPAELHATFDAKYGILIVHPTKQDAEHERRRDPRYIRILTYSPKP